MILILLTISGVSASKFESDSPSLRIIAEEVSPEPVEPGQDITVKIRLMDEGCRTAEDVSLRFKETHPFFLKSEGSSREYPLPEHL